MDRPTKPALLLSMLAGLALSANAWGQDPPRPAMADGDGLLSAQAHAAAAKAMFERMDADHDGHLTAAEMDAAHAMMMKPDAGMPGGPRMSGMGKGMGMMAMMDSDGDGAISAQEHAAHAKAMFDSLDADHDASVTAAEFAAGHHAMMKTGHGKHHGPAMPGMPGMPAGMGAGMGAGMSAADRIKRLDGDGDGKVSAAEHAAGAQAMFADADSDKDGALSSAERAAHHAAMMGRPMDAGEGDGQDGGDQ